jgi:integration host factor subunit beta
MTRSELIEQLAAKNTRFTSQDAALAVHVILDGISRTLAKGGRVEIRGFGVFGKILRSPRKGRNPMTGETVMVPAKSVPHFKPGKELRERVDYD